MMSKPKVALWAATMAFATSAAAAQGGGFPNLDVEKNCRSRAKSTEEMLGDQTIAANVVTQCLKSERQARAALSAAWKDIPANYRAMCIKPNDYSPSYAEWIACLEMNIDVKSLHQKK
jgi:hypothetical protein